MELIPTLLCKGNLRSICWFFRSHSLPYCSQISLVFVSSDFFTPKIEPRPLLRDKAGDSYPTADFCKEGLGHAFVRPELFYCVTAGPGNVVGDGCPSRTGESSIDRPRLDGDDAADSNFFCRRGKGGRGDTIQPFLLLQIFLH